MYQIQSIVINKHKMNLDSAINWVHLHHYKLNKIDETENEYRFRQEDPELLKSLGYTNYKTLLIDKKHDIKLIIVYKELP